MNVLASQKLVDMTRYVPVVAKSIQRMVGIEKNDSETNQDTLDMIKVPNIKRRVHVTRVKCIYYNNNNPCFIRLI